MGAGLAGCSAPPAATEPALARVAAQSPADYDHLWESVGNTLRDYAFRLDREDRQEGIITTYPETAAYFTEFWRPQSQNAYIALESNLHTVQNQAKVTIKPIEEAGAYDISVTVDRTRYSLEERQIDNSAAALRLFSSGAPTMSGRMERPTETAQWIPLGRDPFMEQSILTAILKNYARPVAATTQPADAQASAQP